MQTEGVLFDGKEWKLAVTRRMFFWHMCLSNYGHYHAMPHYGIDTYLETLSVSYQGITSSTFFYDENYVRYVQSIMQVLAKREGLDFMKKQYRRCAKKVTADLEACFTKLNTKNWETFMRSYAEFCATLNPTTTMGRSGAEALLSHLRKKNISSEKAGTLVSIITYPEENTPLFLSQWELLKIGASLQKKILKKNKLRVALKEWVTAHGYIPVNFCEEPWTIQDAKSQLELLLKKDCAQEMRTLKKEHRSRVQESKVVLEEIGDPDIAQLAKALAEATTLNEFRKNVISKLSLDYRRIFKRIAKRCGSSDWRDVFYLTPEESARVVDGEALDIFAIKKEREIVGSYMDIKGEHIFLDSKTAQKFQDCINLAQKGTKKEKGEAKSITLRGSGASRGTVQGIVKIILSPKDFSKLTRGDILVTTMTSVDFVPIMEKAAAFVTNEGGITSHAAIVAREMKKPCIIGTKIATKFLKDGDMVEVDAERGVVKILQRAERYKEDVAIKGEKK